MMSTNRLEAFSDGVLAIIITIMVLELEIPEGNSIIAFQSVLPTFITYILSFIYLSIYWINHHKLMHETPKTNGKILWANLHLLFWLSLFPFATGYMGNNHFEKLPTAFYGFIMFMASIAWAVLLQTTKKLHEKNYSNTLQKLKSKPYLSILLYSLAIGLSYFSPLVSGLIYTVVAVLWVYPIKN